MGAAFEAGDRLIVVRKGLPIARLTVRRVEEGHATAAIERLVANAAPVEEDEAQLEQNPAERRAGRLRSRVLRVEGKGDQTVWFPADAADGAAIDDRWTVRDGGSYIGMVEVQELRSPFAVGQAFAAMCRRPVRVGDELVRRDPRDVRAGRTPLHVFRVEGNYALINAGESDQLVRDQRLYVVREGRVRATLVVTTVKMDFCGTRIEPVTSNEAAVGGVVADDDVYVTLPKAPMRRAVATIEWVEADGRVAAAKLREGATMRPGEVVSVRSEGGAHSAGIVVAAGREGATIYLPPISRAGRERGGGGHLFGIGTVVGAASPGLWPGRRRGRRKRLHVNVPVLAGRRLDLEPRLGGPADGSRFSNRASMTESSDLRSISIRTGSSIFLSMYMSTRRYSGANSLSGRGSQ